MGMAIRAPPQLLQCELRVSPALQVPASEQSKVELVLSLGVFLEDLRVICVEDLPPHRRSNAAAHLALDPRDQATGRAQGVLLGRGGLKARRLPI
jgi:hypothetical protein